MRFLGSCFLVTEVISAGSEFQTISMNFITVFPRFLDAFYICMYTTETSMHFMVDSIFHLTSFS